MGNLNFSPKKPKNSNLYTQFSLVHLKAPRIAKVNHQQPSIKYQSDSSRSPNTFASSYCGIKCKPSKTIPLKPISHPIISDISPASKSFIFFTVKHSITIQWKQAARLRKAQVEEEEARGRRQFLAPSKPDYSSPSAVSLVIWRTEDTLSVSVPAPPSTWPQWWSI